VSLLTTKEVAALLRVHPKHVYRLMRRDLPALRVGDEWRFDRDRVLAWARSRGARATDEAGHETAGLVAANGDRVIDLLLAQCARTSAPAIGFVLADHTAGASLLRRRLVLAAGRHAGIASLEENGEAAAPSSPKAIRLQLVAREVGIAAARGARPKGLGALAGKRIAIRPKTSGLRRRLDGALDAAGIEAATVYRKAVELACHRDVALAVAREDAAYGLTTHAWAQAAGLSFLPIDVEEYDLSFLADHADDTRIVALCEAAQSAAFKKLLRACAGYDPSRAGRVRAG
jgi:excisionase family DNA binding protein